MAIKYVLLDFFDEDPPSIDVGKTEWIDENIDESNYASWIGKEVMCSWHHGGGGGKKRSDVTRCAAKIICFGDDRNWLIKQRNSYAQTGELNKTSTPLGKGNRKRKPKRFHDWLHSSSDDDENDENEEPIVKKKNDKNQQASSLRAMENLRKELEGCSEEPKTKNVKNHQASSVKAVENMRKEPKGCPQACNHDELKKENKRLIESNEKLKKQVSKLNEALACIDYLPDVLEKMKTLTRKRHTSDMQASCPQPTTKRLDSSSLEESSSDSDMVTLARNLEAPRSIVRLWTKGNLSKYVADALLFFFTREEMANHSLSGTVSNAHKGKPTKPALPKEITVPLIEHLTKEFSVKDHDVKAAIRAKLNTESKLWVRQHGDN